MRFPVAAAFALLLSGTLPGTAWAAWLEARSANFTVYSDGTEAELRAAIAQLENQDRLLRQVTRIQAPAPGAPLKIYLVANRLKLREAVAVSPNTYGIYSTKTGGTAFIAVRGGGPGLGGDEIARHEYTHHFMMRHQPDYYPLWYAEGFAEYFMTAAVTDGQAELGRPSPGRLAALRRGGWPTADRLMFEPNLTGPERRLFHAASWLLVHYLYADSQRRAALEAYLQAQARGTPARAAFVQAFGYDTDRLDADLRLYLESGPVSTTMALEAAPAAAIAIRELPAAADQLLLPHLQMVLGGIPNAQPGLLEDIRRMAALAPDDAYARRVLARAEIFHGDRQEGTLLADGLLKSAPQDAELLFIRGMAEYLAGRPDAAGLARRCAAARPWFEKAFKSDPFDYPAAYRLSECEFVAGASAQATEHLVFAQSQAPMASEIAIQAASVLSRRGRHEAARRILTPIAANPQWEGGRRAREMLDKMQGAARWQ